MGKTKKTATPAAPARPAIYYSLHTLLETIRVIKVYEDPLCTLLHAIRSAGSASPEVEGELQLVLDEMPSAAYAQELNEVRGLLAQETGPSQQMVPSLPSARSETGAEQVPKQTRTAPKRAAKSRSTPRRG